MVEQRLPAIDGDEGHWGEILNLFLSKEHYNSGTDSVTNGSHQKITIQPGTASAGTAPLKFSSGTLLSSPEAGAVEFNTDTLYFTQTTSTTRKKIAAYDDTSGATGDIYYRNSSGYFTRLGVGSTGNMLTVSGGIPSWSSSISNASTITLKDTNFTLQDDGDTTKQAKFELSGITTSTTRTYTLPDADTTLVGTGTTQTLTGKTISGSSNTLTNIAQSSVTNLITNLAAKADIRVFNTTNMPTAGTNKAFSFNFDPESSTPTFLPGLYNDLAYLVERGGTITVTKNGGAYTWASLATAALVPDSTFALDTVSSQSDIYVITLDLPASQTLRYGTYIGVVFAEAWVAKDVTIEYYKSGWNTLYTVTNSTDPIHIKSYTGDGTTITSIRYTFTNLASAQHFRITSLFAFDYSSPYLSKGYLLRNGGAIYGTSATPVTFTATGGDSSIGVNLVPKGTGRLQAGGVNVPTISSTDTLTNKTISGSSNTLSNIANASLTNSAITIAGTSTSLGGSITQDTITGLSSTGLVKRTGANTLAIATSGTDYTTPTGTENLQNKTLNNTNTVTLKDTLFTLQDDGDATKQAQFQLSSISTSTTRTYTLPNASGTFLLSSSVTVADNAFTLQDDGDATKQLQFQLSGITTGTTRTITVPDASTTIVGTDATQTLTNKTLTTPVIDSIKDSNGNTQLSFSATGSAVNYVSMTNATTGNSPSIASAGSDTNLGLALTSKGSASVTIRAGGNNVAQFMYTASAVNYIRLTPAVTTGAPILSAFSATDTNVDLNLAGQGTGVVKAGNVEVTTISGTQTLTNKTLTSPVINNVKDTNGNTIFSYQAFSNAVNYMTSANTATGTGPYFYANGSDTNVDLNLGVKGLGTINVIATVNTSTTFIAKFVPTASAVNSITFANSVTGTGPSISAAGSDTDIDLRLISKGSGTVKANGVPVTTTTGTQTLTNKTISGSSNTLSDTFTLTTTGTSGAATYNGTTLNIPQYPNGDVVGPGSSTDNAIVRFDGTTGKAVQNSSATIADDGTLNVSGTVNTGTGGVYSYNGGSRYIRFNTSGTYNDFLSAGAKLVINFAGFVDPQDVTFFESTKASFNPYVYIYGYDAGASTSKYGRINVGTDGKFQLEAQSGKDFGIITGGSERLTITSAGAVQANGVEVATISGTQTLTNKTLTNPKISSIYDVTNGKQVLGIGAQASAVNYLYAYGTDAGASPQLAVFGADTDINLDLYSKGSGVVRANAIPIVTTSGAQTLTNKTISGASNTLSNIGNSSLTNSAITIAGTSTSLGGSITQDTITGLSSTGLVKRTGANTLAIAASGTDYAPATSGTSVLKGNGSGGFSSATAGTDYVTPNGTETLTNKTISGSSNTLSNIALSSLAAAAYNTTPTASTLAEWDANKNLSANAFFEGFTTTATAAGTTTLTISSTQTQIFTGSTTQTVKLPTTSVPQGAQWLIVNQSSGAVTVQSSGANTITVLAANTSAVFTSVVSTPTGASDWQSQYGGVSVASGKSLSVSNTLTLAGTDSTTMTFPGSSDTVATLAATQTLTNKRVNPRVGSTTSSATPTINTDTYDTYGLTAQAVDITSFTTNLSGTPVDGQKLWIYIVGTAARAITWGASFENGPVALPTTTVTTQRLDVGFIWNTATSKWRCVAWGSA